MKRNIVICSDGTGNTFDKKISNVTRLIKLLELGDQQIVVYDQGVGTNSERLAAVERYRESILGEKHHESLVTLPGPKEWRFRWANLLLRLLGLVGGYGLKANVGEMYKKLAQLYKGPEDKIFLFGFSRGAFSVRALAGLLYHCGLPRATVAEDAANFKSCFEKAWQLYKTIHEDDEDIRANEKEVKVFQHKYCEPADCEICFLGLWDTVKSYGGVVPIKLPHLRHNPIVRKVRHALALNEHRSWFDATTWGQLDSDDNGARQRLKPGDQENYARQDIDEAWFRGCHSDIGGGDVEEVTGKIALRWMLGEAYAAELQLNTEGMRELCRDEPEEPAEIHDLYGKWWWADFVPRFEIDNSGRYPRRKIAWGRNGRRRPQNLTRKGMISLHPTAARLRPTNNSLGVPRMSLACLPVRQTKPAYQQVEAETVLNAMKAGCGANFEQAEINGSICLNDFIFNEPVRFSNCDFFGKLDLSGCRFNKGFSFIGCVFEHEVWFEGARADGDSQFRACVFYRECRFDRLHVKGKLDVRAPRNVKPLKGNRYYTQDDKRLKYWPYVIFKEHANFSQVHISGEANFGSVQFLKGADFYNARIDGPAFFRRDGCKEKDEEKKFPDEHFENTCFGGETVRFRDAHFGSELDFKGAQFHCDANFTYVHCQGIVFFCDELKPEKTPEQDRCNFLRNLDFEGGRFETSLRLDMAKFNDEHEVNFRDCRIAETLAFTTVPKRLIMTGCSYKRMTCADPTKKDFVEALKLREDSQRKFDRSSWVQLETTLRNGGEVQLADAVYRDRMAQERKLELAGYQKTLSRVWELVAGYGTASWKLAVICCLMLLIGTVTLRLGDFKQATKDGVACPRSTATAIEVSLSQFSPFKLPVGEDCAPEGWSKAIALLLRIGGWILVPLVAANLAGLLHRKAGPTRESGGGDE
jgi:uncharacterized protein (DUF2235 family)